MNVRLDVLISPYRDISFTAQVAARKRLNSRILAPDGNTDRVFPDEEQTPVMIDRYLVNAEIAMNRFAVVDDKYLEGVAKIPYVRPS